MAAKLLALLLALPALAAVGLAGDPAPCPVASPSTAAQNDGGSGRDAGPSQASAVQPRPRYGVFWGHLDNFFEYGLVDMNDWYRVDLQPGPRDVTVSVRALLKTIDPEAQPPTIYYIELWRQGAEFPTYDGPSWDPPFTYGSPGGERLFVHIMAHQLSAAHLCGEAPAAVGIGLLPADPQTYRVQFECAPSC